MLHFCECRFLLLGDARDHHSHRRAPAGIIDSAFHVIELLGGVAVDEADVLRGALAQELVADAVAVIVLLAVDH